MRNRKTADNADRPQTGSPRDLAGSLAALISAQLETGCAALKFDQKELAALVACQIFDAIDWARLNIGRDNLATLDTCVLSLLKTHLRFRTLEDLEDYAETHFVGDA